MVRSKIISVFLVILVVANGCVTERQRAQICLQCGTKADTLVQTSTVTQTVYQTVKTPADSAWYKALVECQNGKPILINEETNSGADLSIFRLITRVDTGKARLMVKAVSPPKTVSVPGSKEVKTDSKEIHVLQQPAYACPPCKHWRWYVWLLIGIFIAQLPKLWRLGLNLYKKLRYPL